MAATSYDKCSSHPPPPLSFSFFISYSAPETEYSLAELPQPTFLPHTWPPERNIQQVVYEQPSTHRKKCNTVSTVLWINEHRKRRHTHTHTHTSKLLHCQWYLSQNHFDIETCWSSWLRRKNNLFPFLPSILSPVASASLSKSLFHPGDSGDKHVVSTKDSRTPTIESPFFAPSYKRSIFFNSGLHNTVKNKTQF